MNKLILNLVLAVLVASTQLSAIAVIKTESLAGEFFEGRNISIRGKKLQTGVTLTTIDNQNFNLTGSLNKKSTKITLQLPLISADAKVRLTFTDRDGSKPINVVIYNDPTLENGGVDIFDNAPVLPASIETGIATAGPQGPPGEEGPAGPAGPPGAPGPSPTSIPGATVVGPVASASIVLNATQSNITTLPNLISAGTAGTTTNFLGPINANQGFVGDLTGNISGSSASFTGALAGDITGSQGATVLSSATLFSKTLQGSYAASAGVVAIADDLETALEKLDGNIQANDTDIAANATAITAIQGVNATQTTNITTNTTAIGTPTAINNPNQIVKRDGAGSFAAGRITAKFLGNLNGDVLGNVTGNVTGNTSGSAASFTTALAGDVTGLQGATVLQPAALFTKTLQAGYASLAGPIAIGDTLEVAIEKLDGNVKANVTAINNNSTNINTNTNNIAAIQAVNTTQTANIATNAANIATNTTNIATNTTAIGTPTAANTPNQIVKRNGAGNFAASRIQAVKFLGDVNGNVLGDVTGNVSGSSASFTGALAGDVTGTQGATVLEESALFAKTLQAGYAALAGTVTIGDSLELAIEKLDGNVQANTTAIATNTTDITTLQTTVTTNTTDIASNTTDIAAIASGPTPVAVSMGVDIDGLTTFDATDINVVVVEDSDLSTLNDVETLATITGGVAGQRLVIVFGTLVNASVDIDVTDSATCTTPDDIRLEGGTATFVESDVLELIYMNGCWNEVSRSINSL